MTFYSHDILEARKTVRLSPLAVWRQPGGVYDTPRSAIRALQILELLASAERPLRAVEIGRGLNLSPSSTSQLLKIMTDWAYLIFDPFTKRYYPSPSVAGLGATPARDYLGFEPIKALMNSLKEHCDRSVSLCVSQGSYMQVVDSVPKSDAPGLQVPLFGSCTGAAWLSAQSEKRILAAMKLCRRELGAAASKPAAILDQIGRIKAQGYAFGGMTLDDGSRALAMPLPANRHGTVLVICMTGRRERMERQREDLVHITKGLITRQLKVHEASQAMIDRVGTEEDGNAG